MRAPTRRRDEEESCTEEQIVGILKESEAGLDREAQRLRQLEDENRKLTS